MLLVLSVKLILSVLYCAVAAVGFVAGWRRMQEDDDSLKMMAIYGRDTMVAGLAVACTLWPAVLAYVVEEEVRKAIGKRS